MEASTQLITDDKAAITTGPDATSTANAIAAVGPIQDLKGNLELLVVKLQETRRLIDEIDTVVDSGDPIQTQITDIKDSLD